MPHYSGSANSFADLQAALFSACVANGWSLSGDILTFGAVALRVNNNTTQTTDRDIGLVLQGGTGVSAGALVNPSPNQPRMGRVQTGGATVAFPVAYNIHIHLTPMEVYLEATFNVDYQMWLAFGVSTIPGLLSNGLWLSANAVPQPRSGSTGGVGIALSASTTGNMSTCAPFFRSSYTPVSSPFTNQDAVASGLDGVIWAGNPTSQTFNAVGSFSAAQHVATLLSVHPNTWNSDAPLTRIQAYQARSANKWSMILDLVHARYLRIDNYDPGQIITLGSDRWKIYPFYRKNSAQRNGGTAIDHTGTFGWAIRYDGP